MTSAAPRAKQEVFLAVLFDEAPDRIQGVSRIQKVAFLMQELGDRRTFDFTAGDYGPKTREVYDVLHYFLRNDVVEEHEKTLEDGRVVYEYEAGPRIQSVFGHADHDDLREVAQRVFDKYPVDDLQALLDRVYTEFPMMARNSVY
ncbi:hypothetical protein [Halobacterium salinarum]|uniref:hypothetical protein n=1 Tax=Halobacterium salinarum TaxID=2242 RepID=UPI001F181C8D|nr:hypothetical protein [Halobacterium salinarum]MCF2165417.1 hypothetical protein [Halobacterium salinarum]MCF2168325.1 hypothetical protein [Halobacterium salinarum]